MWSLKTQCEVLVIAASMGIALLGGILAYPTSAVGLIAAGGAGIVVMAVMRRPLLQSVGIDLVPDEAKLKRLRSVLFMLAVVFYVAVVVAAVVA
ncbi:MAG: hypothetical protein O9327_03265 [Polaromonas sp.]|nr:hypothetical protein [Polaromonas sp.]